MTAETIAQIDDHVGITLLEFVDLGGRQEFAPPRDGAGMDVAALRDRFVAHASDVMWPRKLDRLRALVLAEAGMLQDRTERTVEVAYNVFELHLQYVRRGQRPGAHGIERP